MKDKLLQREIYRKKHFQDGFFIKEFGYEHPHPKTALERLKLFEDIQKYHIFPQSSLIIDTKKITLKQKQILGEKLSSLSAEDAFVMSQPFVRKIKTLWRLGFVHGDINRRNIFCNEGRLGLFDFEPYLVLEKDGVNKLIATDPYICPRDLKERQLTQSSDMIGFACFLNWFCFDRATAPFKFYKLTLKQDPEKHIRDIFLRFT